MAVNKVAKSDGTTLIDITPTTAIQSDVAKDKIFFLADGRQAVGTNEGGSGSVTWETMADQTCTITTYDGVRIIIINGYDEPLSADETYRITWGDTQYICNTYADPVGFTQDGYYIGNSGVFGSQYEDTGEPFALYRTSSTRMTGATNDTASSVYVKIEKQVTSSATLVTKTIAANGTYYASSDGADGYSQVTVNVPTSAGAAMNTQIAQGVNRVATPSYTAVSGQSITVETTGTYDVYRTGFRSSTGGTPSQTQHTIYFEFSDNTNTTITAYWDGTFISDAIRATTPTTYNNKTVTLAQLDGTTWYEPAAIPLNTQLINYNSLTNNKSIDATGNLEDSEWYSVSDYTEIDPTMTFTYRCNLWFNIGFYDSTKSTISAMSVYGNATPDAENDQVGVGTLNSSNIPATAKYVRLTSVSHPDSTELSLIRTA